MKINPQTLAVRDVIREPAKPSFGAGTVAVEVGNQIWVGSFHRRSHRHLSFQSLTEQLIPPRISGSCLAFEFRCKGDGYGNFLETS